MTRALITGISGQDASYLAELLLSKGYELHGIIRRSSSPNIERISHIIDKIHLHEGDLSDGGSLTRIVRDVRPHETYHLAAQSFVKASFAEPDHTGEVTGLGTVRMLEAIRQSGFDSKFYHAASSEMFGSSPSPQSESTPFHPRSPYASAKVFGYNTTINYREAYGIHASNGILFNHESPRRGLQFVTRKITNSVVNISRGKQEVLKLGNLDAKRDWGYAGDYVEAMWLMLQQRDPGDYVIATGETHSVREFVDLAFKFVGLDWNNFVEIDPALYRPAEVDELRGDASKARLELAWTPKVNFVGLVGLMMEAELSCS